MVAMHENPLDPERLAETLRNLGAEWADYEAAAQLLEETKRTVRSEIAQRAAQLGAPTAAAADRHAEAHADYKVHVEAMVEARRLANRSRVNYDSHRVLVDLIRTKEATSRAEMTLR